jgi:hypothetical protein
MPLCRVTRHAQIRWTRWIKRNRASELAQGSYARVEEENATLIILTRMKFE